MQRIDSPKNPTIKAMARLKDKRSRAREGYYLIEGVRELSRALEAGVELERAFIVPEILQADGKILLARLTKLGVERLELSPAAFAPISMRQSPDGVVGLARTQPRDLATLALPGDALVLVIDGLEKPGNVGALLRSADASGLAAVFLSGAGTDLYNPNVIRASMGSVFSRPVLAVDTDILIHYLQTRGFALVAATPAAQRLYWHEDLTGPTALVLGPEHKGLGATWLNAATSQVAIPMHGLADSLNVSVSGALLMYEALRQRAGQVPL